jgi:cell division control protein 24
MMKWYNTLQDLHTKAVKLSEDVQNGGLQRESRSVQRQTFGFSRDRAMSLLGNNARSGYNSEYEGQRDGFLPITPPGSGSDGEENSLQSQAMSRTASGSTSGRGQSINQIPRKPAPNRFPVNPHGLPPHSRSGSLGVNTDFQGSYFSPIGETPPVPSRPMSPYSAAQFPFPPQRDEMGRSLSRDGYNGMPTPPLTANSMRAPERPARPTIAPLNTTRSRSASTPNIHQIQTNVGRGRDLPPPLPVSRRDRDPDSPTTPHSPGSPISSSRPTTGTSTFASIPETPSSASSTSARKLPPSTPNSTKSSLDKASALKVKITYGNDMFVVVVPSDVTYNQLVQKVRHKLSVCSNVGRDGPLRMKYQDEDGDLVTVSSDEDVAMAVDSRSQHNNSANAGIAGAGVISLLVFSSSI